MKRAVLLFLCLVFLLTAFLLPAIPARALPALADGAPAVSAQAVFLMDAASGYVLYEQNADTAMKIASTTKIMTALVALEHASPDKLVDIKPEWTGAEGSSMYLKAGERVSVRDLLYGLMLPSGNDAAVALACAVAGSVEDFAVLMNEKAAALGCEDTHFVNPNGLDAPEHYASARGLAKITAAAMQNSVFCEIVSTKYVNAAGRSLKNHNKLLWDYEGMLGVKTGYTKSAGRSLVTCAERGNMRIICVTLDDPNDWADHTALYDWAFNSFERVTVSRLDSRRVTVPVISGVSRTVTAHPDGDYSFILQKGAEYELDAQVPQFVYAVVVKGARAGSLVLRQGGTVVACVPLVYGETVMQDKTAALTGWEKLKRAWYLANEYSIYPRFSYY